MTQNKARIEKVKRKTYDHLTIEPKWQAKWEKGKVYQPNFEAASDGAGSQKGVSEANKKISKARKPFFNLMMFPYPSAEGLHVGSVYTFGGVDVYGRFKRMAGYEVF